MNALDELYRTAVQTSHAFSNGRATMADVDAAWNAAWSADPMTDETAKVMARYHAGEPIDWNAEYRAIRLRIHRARLVVGALVWVDGHGPMRIVALPTAPDDWPERRPLPRGLTRFVQLQTPNGHASYYDAIDRVRPIDDPHGLTTYIESGVARNVFDDVVVERLKAWREEIAWKSIEPTSTT